MPRLGILALALGASLAVYALTTGTGNGLATASAESEPLAAAEPSASENSAPPRLAPPPEVKSAAAIVFDMDTGAVYYKKNPDEVRHIASTGKIYVAMLARRKGIDLSRKTAITATDRYWARGGSRTRLPVHHSLPNIDLLRAMLMASDNRAPTALGHAVGLEPEQMIEELNELARDLRLPNTKFTDVAGIRGNVSTAREMARAFRAAMRDAVLREVMSTKEAVVITSHSFPLRIVYRNTNLPMHSERYPITGGKTGYNDPAGYCLLTSARIRGRHIGMIFLGADSKLTRFADFYRIAGWLDESSADVLEANIGTVAGGVGAL